MRIFDKVEISSRPTETNEETMESKQKQQQIWEELIQRNKIGNNQPGTCPENDPNRDTNCTAATISTDELPPASSKFVTHTSTTTDISAATRHWPSYDHVLQHLSTADYSNILTCPYDLQNFGSSNTATTFPMCTGRAGSERPPHHTIASCPQQKILCPHGVVACADMTIFSNVPYTGLLDTTNTTGQNTTFPCIIRLSSAMRPPSEGITSTWGRTLLYTLSNSKIRNAQIFPCAAIKVFRDNDAPSGNLLFGGSKLGQRETDFFAHCLCTSMTEQMPRPIKPFVRKFWTYSDYPLSLGVSDFCKTHVDGSVVNDDEVAFPFAIILRPCVQAHARFIPTSKDQNMLEKVDNSFDSFLDRTAALPIGAQLYDIFACPEPLDVPDASKLQRIGYITMTSKMIQSSSSDGLIFRHQKKEDDYRLRPDWPMALKNRVSFSNGLSNGTIGQLTGWKLFEEHIAEGTYVDFEQKGNDMMKDDR